MIELDLAGSVTLLRSVAPRFAARQRRQEAHELRQLMAEFGPLYDGRRYPEDLYLALQEEVRAAGGEFPDLTLQKAAYWMRRPETLIFAQTAHRLADARLLGGPDGLWQEMAVICRQSERTWKARTAELPRPRAPQDYEQVRDEIVEVFSVTFLGHVLEPESVPIVSRPVVAAVHGLGRWVAAGGPAAPLPEAARNEIAALLDRELVWEDVEDYRGAFEGLCAKARVSRRDMDRWLQGFGVYVLLPWCKKPHLPEPRVDHEKAFEAVLRRLRERR